ncbi:hypothetical protein SAMN05428944_2679 [Streptomyces sp. 1222.5]|uniref:hypothetical protein n=1 Tax=unclassified Streptomyces TaxID=2593676 RepID=UPI000895C26B|nr:MULTISPECIES: hypothetical protein [unclassified Streptomyces]PKW10141.1 hypothetical protein BX260_5413 [Streptomyces sp. 5112.2]SEC14423.1 hypothetical protein SAMN05428944_2679 [Streptomyces sp. 1222.5]SED78344.1 hypothetical protein SAMN05216532_5694 [Streptomyces sp. 2231.1]
MPADEAIRGTDVDGSRARTGPRHAAPRKPLFTRFHMPAGKAIASVAMPTAVIVGMGFTSTLALADNGSPSPSTSAKSLTADEYKDCVKALDDSGDTSASPSPSASESTKPTDTATPGTDAEDGKDAGGAKDTGKTSSPDSGSGDQGTPEPSATSGSSDPGSGTSDKGSGSGGDTATPTPSASQSSGNLLDTIGDTLGDVLTGGGKDSGTSSASPTPSASPSSAAPSASASGSGTSTSDSAGTKVSDTVKDTASKAGKTVSDTVKNTTDKVSKTAEDTVKAAQDAAGSATPAPSASASDAADGCPVATDDESGVDNKTPVADDPWYLNASSLLLKGADYQGVVEVKTANGTKKKVLKYVISGGTDIGDLHQTVNDKQANKTYHVQAAKGSTSTIRNGDTVMYTESISGNLFGLIPVTFSPDSPPPLNIPLIYFTNVKVVQAAQFGGSLHVPGMHVYTTG